MPRISHGSAVTFQQIDTALETIDQFAAAIGQPHAGSTAPDWARFDYLFLDLQYDGSNLLPRGHSTVAALKALGESMTAPPEQVFESKIPSAYAYFGQFIDHDIIFRVVKRDVPLDGDDLEPLSLAEARKWVTNGRTAKLDLDSVYGSDLPVAQRWSPPREGDKMALGRMNQTAAGGYVLTVFLDDPDARGSLPAEVDGYRVEYEVTRPFRKLPANDIS